MSEFIKPENVEWKTVKYLKSSEVGPEKDHVWDYEMVLPRPLADWDVFAVWEKERIWSMRDNLKKGDVLFDIGTEQGWCNLIYAQFVGPENMVLIEPTQEFWPNIHATWKKNYPGVNPKAFYDGLISDKTTDVRTEGFIAWPNASNAPLIDRNKYQYIDDNTENVPEMTIDDYVRLTGIIPNALTMDTEGAEIAILRGAEDAIRKYRPLIWASIHPELAVEHGFGDTRNVYDFMEMLGYKHQHLATDHEVHEFFYPDDYWPRTASGAVRNSGGTM